MKKILAISVASVALSGALMAEENWAYLSAGYEVGQSTVWRKVARNDQGVPNNARQERFYCKCRL